MSGPSLADQVRAIAHRHQWDGEAKTLLEAANALDNPPLDDVLGYLDTQAAGNREAARTFRRPRGGFSTNETLANTRASALENAAKAIRAGEHRS